MNQTQIKITTFINNATFNHSFLDKDIELHAEELRQCTGRNTEAEWKELAPSLYDKYIKVVRQREQERYEYQMHTRSLQK